MNEDVLRILDVNVNRAREALRVAEDYARFILDDADAAAELKRCRHSIQEFVETVGVFPLLDARDITGDVGRDVKTEAELRRDHSDDVVAAAFARLTEAARSMSEYAKACSTDAALKAESLRYAAYELEQRVVLRGPGRARLRAVRLYVLITEALCRHDWLKTAEAALRGGATCLQLREKRMGDAKLLRRACQLRELTAKHQALLAINDRADIARLARADIVHVGQDDLSVGQARRVAGTGMLVGKSTHNVEQFEAAAAEQPDYIAVGPMFASDTKPQEHAPGPALLAAVTPRTDLPVMAIGGITPDSAATITEAGASCVCVCAAVIGADDPAAAARSIIRSLGA